MKTPPRIRPVVTVSDEKLAARCALGRVVIIDDDTEFLVALATLIEMEGYACETYDSAAAYLQVLDTNRPEFPGPCCVLCDVRMPGIDGLELQHQLGRLAAPLSNTPIVFMSGNSGAPEAVSALRAGAFHFLIKPFEADLLLKTLLQALATSSANQAKQARSADLAARIASLTVRELEVARRVIAGQTNPEIADALSIALRTVKRYRQAALEKLGVSGTAELVRLAGDKL